MRLRAVNIVHDSGCPLSTCTWAIVAIPKFYDGENGGKLLSQRPNFRANATRFGSLTIFSYIRYISINTRLYRMFHRRLCFPNPLVLKRTTSVPVRRWGG